MKGGRLLLVMALCTGVLSDMTTLAQEHHAAKKKKGMALMKDTLDGHLDFSRFLIDAHGFIPVPLIITEPALGGLGLAVAPIFLSPKKNIPKDMGYVPPDITAAFGMLTANGSWAAGAAQIGSIPKAGIKYRIGGAYVDVNMKYYRELPNEGEKAFEFNIRSFPVMGSISKRIARTDLYAGLQYTYASTKLRGNFQGDVPDFVKEKELKSQVGTLGAFLDWDSRNSVFTPDKGIRAQLAFNMDDEWTGSDFTYQKLEILANWFQPMNPKWVSGLRLEGSSVYGDAPFFLLPSVNLRGIPLARYQGQSVLVLETEQRFDLNLRWSLVGFLGYGRTFNENNEYLSSDNVYNAGGGFRYLLSRVFRVRTGVDIAVGPDSWGWYIVFGHNWNR